MIAEHRDTPHTAVMDPMARVLALVPLDPDVGVMLARKALAAAPNDPDALTTLGANLLRQKNLADALQTLQTALDAHGKGGLCRTWLYLALAKNHPRDRSEALAFLTKSRDWPASADKLTREERIEHESLLREASGGLLGLIDLTTSDGMQAVQGQWRFAPVKIGVGPKMNDLEPKAHGKFADASWEMLAAEALSKTRGASVGGWYRTQMTIPSQIAGRPFEGGPVWFQTVPRGYGEIFIDGNFYSASGNVGRSGISGIGVRQRVRLQKDEIVEKDGKKVTVKRDPRPGDNFQVAVFALAGPIGGPSTGPGRLALESPTNLEFLEADIVQGGVDPPDIAPPPFGSPIGKARLDLLVKGDVEKVQGIWQHQSAMLHLDGETLTVSPQGFGDVDKGSWDVVADAADLKKPFALGAHHGIWHQLEITLPEQNGGEKIQGSSSWLRLGAGTYAEVWVNGKLDASPGTIGRGAISGINGTNLLLLTENAQPGQKFQITVLALKGPFGNPPASTSLSFRSAEILFYRK